MWSLLISALGVAVALVLVALGRGKRRVRPAPDDPDYPSEPLWARLFTERDATIGPWATAGSAAGFGVAVALLTPWHGWSVTALVLVVVAAVVGTFRARWGRGVASLLAAGSLGVAALYTVQAQFRHPNPADFQWPVQFEKVAVFGLLALFLLLVEGVRELLVRAQRRRTEPAPT